MDVNIFAGLYVGLLKCVGSFIALSIVIDAVSLNRIAAHINSPLKIFNEDGVVPSFIIDANYPP